MEEIIHPILVLCSWVQKQGRMLTGTEQGYVREYTALDYNKVRGESSRREWCAKRSAGERKKKGREKKHSK